MEFTITAYADLTLPEISQLLNEPTSKIVLDVRTSDEFSAGFLQQAINIPINELATRLEELPPTNSKAQILCYCRSGTRSHNAAIFLRERGYDAINIGGYDDLIRVERIKK
jgi:phage shock protein E